MVITRSVYQESGEPIVSLRASRIPRLRPRSSSASSLQHRNHHASNIAITTDVSSTVPPSHFTGIGIPAQSSGSKNQDYERLPHNRVGDPNELQHHSTLVQEHHPRAHMSDLNLQDPLSVQDHFVQPESRDHFRNDQGLIRDHSLHAGYSDPSRRDQVPYYDQSPHVGNCYPVPLTNRAVLTRLNSLRKDQGSALSDQTPQQEDQHPLRKDPRSPVSCPTSQAELDILWKNRLSLPIHHQRAEGSNGSRDEECHQLVPEHLLQPDIESIRQVHLHHDQRQQRNIPYMNDNDTNNPGVAIHQPDQEFGTGNYPYDTSLSSGYQLQSMHYPDNVHLSRPVSIRRFPTTREHIRPVHPNTGARQGRREVTLPSNDRLHRHQEVVTSSNVKSTEGYREVSLPSIDRLHHHQEVVKSSNVKPIGDHREVIVPSTDRLHRHQEVVMSSNDRPIHDRPYEQQGHQLDHGRVSKPPVTDDRTTIKGSYVRQENLIQRQVGYERAQEHPLQANVASLNGQHRLRESILSNLRVSDKILYNEFYLDMITKDRELLYNIIQDDYLRPIFLSHPIIIEKSMSDPNFLNIEHYPNPIKDSQHSEQHQSCGTVIKDYSSAAASSTLTVDGSRPQQSVPIYDTTVKDITTADDRVPLEQVDSTKPVEVISISSAAKNGSRSHHENYREHHQQPSRRAAMRSTRRRDPSGSPSGSSDSSGDDHDSRRSRRSHQRRRRSLSSSSSSSSPSSASGRALSRPYPTLKHLPGITSGRMYRPPNLFGNKTYDRCPGCRHTKCRHKISDKDLQIATNTAKGLAIKNHYQGADDRRSGAAWIQEIFKRTVGQRNLVRYTFARLNTINTVWDDLVRDETDPALCHKDYDRHWDLLINKINEFYSDQQVLLKLQNDFNHLQQEPKETVNQFISRLDGYANQLCLLGVSILDDIIKRRLYDGLLNDRLRDKMDRDVDDHRIDYPRFKRQLIKYDRRRQGRLSKKEADPATLRLYGGRHPDQRRQATVSNIINNDHSDDYHDGSPIPSGSSTDDDVYYVYAVVRDQQSITCYRCLQDGHPARNCTNDIGKKDERCIRCGNPTHTIDKCNVSTTATCHRCGREGHLAYVCPDPLPSPTVSMRSKGGKGKGKGLGKGKGKSPGPSSIQATTSSTTDGNLQQLPTPPTPEVKISGVDPNENNDDSSDANNEYDIYNDAQTNMIVSHHYPESSILTVSESVPNQLKTMKANSSDKVFGDPKVTSTSNICSSSTSSTRCDVVVGVIKIGPETRPVLFDTGADISLIAIGALEKIFGGDCPIFSSTTNSNVKVANTTSIKVIGHVSIPIETRHIKITERFAVTDNSLSSPVILGCPALQQLQCAIVFTVSGSVVFSGIEDLTSSFHRQIYKTISRSAKQRQPAEIKGFGGVSITHQPTSHVVRVVNDDLPTSSCSTIMASNDVTTHLDLLHGGIWNGKVTNNNAVPRIMNSIPDVITNDPYGATDMEDVPLHPDLQLQSDPTDDLPPWEVIKRQWIPDFSAPLGRCQLSVPWLSSDRPDHNFRIAARRGAASVQRLSPEEKDLFHQSLNTFIDRKYCGIVQDNSIGNYTIPPSSERCQAIWRVLHEGTSMAGSIVPKPIHYTPSHMVFRKDHCTTPCRIVLDYRVLNRFSNRGGSTQHNLVGTLLSVRSMEYVISADISKAFCEMFADPSDIPFIGYTCIGNFTLLWNRVSFGSTCAPAMLETDINDMSDEIYQVISTAKARESSRPPTSTVPGWNLLTEDLMNVLLCPTNDNVDWIRFGPQVPIVISMVWFVDDVYIGGLSRSHTIDCYSFAAHIYEGHHKLFDPNKNFTSWVDEQHQDQPEALKKLLGYLFRRSSDLLHAVYEADRLSEEDCITKRKASSYLLSLYDPLGLVLEHTMVGRLIWRKITEATTDWDAKIADDHRQQVSDWVNASIDLYNDTGWAIDNKMRSRWEGPFTIAKVTSSATVLVAPELILPNRKIWERSNSSSSSPNPTSDPTSPTVDNLSSLPSTNHRSSGPTNITDGHNCNSGIDRLFEDHELQLISLKNVVHAKAFQDLIRDQHLRGQRIYVDHRGSIGSIDSLKDESQDLQRVRELITEGAIIDALKVWRNPTTTTPNDESPSEGGQGQDRQPQGHSISEDLHQVQEDDQLAPSDSPDLIPEDANPSRSSKPRTSRNRHQQGDEKTEDQHDPTAIKATRPLPIGISNLRRHLLQSDLLSTGAILSMSPPDESVVVFLSSSVSSRGVDIVAPTDKDEGRVYLGSIEDDQARSRKCFFSDLVYICGSTTVLTRQHQFLMRELHYSLGIGDPWI